MTLTPSEVAKLQKHNAALVRENETLTRDNAELRGQIEAIKHAAIENSSRMLPCAICKYLDIALEDAPCRSCDLYGYAENWQPPDA